MSQRELQRDHIMRQVIQGMISLREASELMDVSYRQAKRIKATYSREGPRGLIHGNRGRASPHRVPEPVKQRIMTLSKQRYALFNDTHFCQMLAQEENIHVSRETVRRMRRQGGIAAKRKHRSPKHRSRRQRMAREGLLVQWDGSPHHWFGPNHPACCLMTGIDDATSRLLAALFVPHECSLAYLRLLEAIIRKYGIPTALYHDCHTCLHRTDNHWSLKEQLQGYQDPPQVGRAMQELGITSIAAGSPQAKGRVERGFATLQDRLVAELDLRGITEIDAANQYLKQRFIADHNRRFAVAPCEASAAWRPKPSRDSLRLALSFCYEATVGNDNAVRIGGIVIDIPPGPRGRSYAKARVTVRQLLDGSWRVFYQHRLIARKQSTGTPKPLKTHVRKRHLGPADTQVFMASAPS